MAEDDSARKYQLAWHKFTAGDFDEAVAELREFAEQAMASAPKATEEDLRKLEDSLAADPSGHHTPAFHKPSVPSLLHGPGKWRQTKEATDALFREERLRLAEEAAKEAVLAARAHPDSGLCYAISLCDLGFAAARLGRLEDAYAYLAEGERALAVSPHRANHAVALYGLGLVHTLRRQYRDATSVLDRAAGIERSVDGPRWHLVATLVLLAEVSLRDRNRDRAFRAIAEAEGHPLGDDCADGLQAALDQLRARRDRERSRMEPDVVSSGDPDITFDAAERARRAGRGEEAAELYAAAARRYTDQGSDAGVLACSFGLAQVDELTGNNASAIARYSALAADPVVRAEPSAHLAVLRARADLHTAAGHAEEAQSRYAEALVVAVQVYGADHPECHVLRKLAGTIRESISAFASLIDAGHKALDREDLAAADSAYRAAINDARSGDGLSPADEAVALLGLAKIDLARPNVDAAADTLRLAEELLTPIVEQHRNLLVDVIRTAAECHLRRGEMAQTVCRLRDAVAIAEDVVGGNPGLTLALLDEITMLGSQWGRYRDTIEAAEHALELIDRGSGPPASAEFAILGRLAAAMVELGELGDADRILERALKVARFAPRDVVGFGQGVVYLRDLALVTGRHQHGLRLTNIALSLVDGFVQEHGPEDPVVGRFLVTALAPVGELIGADAEKTLALENLAFRTSVATLGRDHPVTLDRVVALARAMLRANTPESALHLLVDTCEREDKQLIRFIDGSDEEQLTMTLARHADRYLAALALLTELPQHPSQVAAVWSLVLRRKGLERELLGLLRLPGATSVGSVAALQGLHTGGLLYDPATKLTSKGSGAITAGARIARARKRRVEETLTDAGFRSATGSHLDRATPKAVIAALSAGTALIDYVRTGVGETSFVGPARYGAFVVTRRRLRRTEVVFVDIGLAADIDNAISDYLQAVERSHTDPARATDAVAATGRLLYDTLIAPLAGQLKHERLIIVPEGSLGLLPFEVLQPAPDRYLVESHAIGYLDSPRDLVRTDRPATSSTAPVVVAAPDFDLGTDFVHSGRPFEALPGTLDEARQVRALLGADCQLWTGSDALDARLKAVRSPSVLHIASHGFFLRSQEKDPLLRSGLALAGANTFLARRAMASEAEDGVLYALDVAGMNLAGTELVVLSACQSGLGDVNVGRGVYGLRRSFAVAGARTIISSMWRIDDRTTVELMVEFYRSLRDGAPASAALRHAQLALIARLRQDKGTAPPALWGGFVCIGDPVHSGG